MRALRVLSIVAAALALLVVVVGAYVRLSDAGLGCPDWPLCYGRPPSVTSHRRSMRAASLPSASRTWRTI